jgi:hypothetical protein
MMYRPYLTYWEQLKVVETRWFRRDSPKRDFRADLVWMNNHLLESIADSWSPPNFMILYDGQTLFDLLGTIRSGRNPLVPSQFSKTWFTTQSGFSSIQKGVLLIVDCHQIFMVNMMDRPYLTHQQRLKVVATRWFHCNSIKRDSPLEIKFSVYRRKCH